jgi:tetratricopeptide (TPR) repeat protein
MGVEDVDRRLADVRKRGDLDELAEVLVLCADVLAENGRLERARVALDEAADIHRQRGRVYDEARCSHLAATLCRLERRLPDARARAQRAMQLVTDWNAGVNPVTVSAATELGEIALAEGDAPEAVEAYTKALVAGEAAGLTESARAALLRKRANALVMNERYQDAVADLDRAHELLVQSEDRGAALRVLVEKATVLMQEGDFAQAERVVQDARLLAEDVEDHRVLADLYLLDATRSMNRGDVESAMSAAKAAREHSLSAVAPIPYVSAALAIAELAETDGDRLAAYEALAVGWATLGDLLGSELAKTTFEPKMQGLCERWGKASFVKIKMAYEARRRTAMGSVS